MTFEEVVEQYEGMVIDRLQKTFINDMEYEDIKQELMLTMWNAYSNFNKDKSKFSTYLYSSLSKEVHKILTRYNRVKDTHKYTSLILDKEYDDSDESILNNIKAYDDVIKNNIRIDMQRDIKNIVKNKLTNKEKSVIALKYKGYTYREISNMYNVSINAVEQRHRSGIKKIREGLINGSNKYFSRNAR